MNTSLRCLETTGEQSAKRKVGRGIEDRIEMGEKLEGSDVKRSGCRRFLAIGHRHEEPVRGLFHLDDVAGPQGFVVQLLAVADVDDRFPWVGEDRVLDGLERDRSLPRPVELDLLVYDECINPLSFVNDLDFTTA